VSNMDRTISVRQRRRYKDSFELAFFHGAINNKVTSIDAVYSGASFNYDFFNTPKEHDITSGWRNP
jgi:hypothetical protein